MNSLGWSRREEAPVNTSQQTGLLSSLKSLNPFGGDGYVQLPVTEGSGAPLPAPNRREEEEGFFARKSRSFSCRRRLVFESSNLRHVLATIHVQTLTVTAYPSYR